MPMILPCRRRAADAHRRDASARSSWVRLPVAVSTVLVLVFSAGVASARQPADGAVAQVRTATVASLQRADPQRAPAEVIAPNRSVIAAETTATVRRVLADVGAAVARGDVLVELDPVDAELALARADAELAAARAQATLAGQRLARGRELGENSFISEDELLALGTGATGAGAQVKVAEAMRAIAARALDKTRVRAPFDATVASRSAQQGELVTPGAPLLTLVSSGAPELSAAVPAELADGLATATRLRFEGAGGTWPVRLLRLVGAIEQSSRTREARLGFDADAPLPGATGTLAWESSGGVLPAALLVRRDGRLGVFQATDGVAHFVAVADAQEGRDFAHGFAPATLLVVEGHNALQDGARLQPTAGE